MADSNTTYDASFAEWRRLLKPLANNIGEIPHLEGHRTKLESVLTRVDEIVAQQGALAAAKQEASRQLKELVVEGRKIATFVKAGIREHYGRRGEKLTEYGVQPFRGFKPAKPAEPEEPVETTPTV